MTVCARTYIMQVFTWRKCTRNRPALSGRHTDATDDRAYIVVRFAAYLARAFLARAYLARAFLTRAFLARGFFGASFFGAR
jgi:hypothetical protein